MFKSYLIAIATGVSFTGIASLGISGCHLGGDIPEQTPSVEITRIPAPRYTAPESTIPIMPTWTYGPGVEAVEVSR